MAFCTNCGAATNPDQRFCVVCGRPLYAPSLTPAPPLNAAEFHGAQEARVIIGLGHEAPRQSRWSVLLRGVLLIPLGLWIIPLSIAGAVVLFLSWWAALFTGRVPDGFQRFLTDVLRYNAKVTAYGNLLTSRWPGMNIKAAPRDQMSIDIDHERLNRAAVFFRIILAIPATLLSDMLSLGGFVLAFVMWLCALVLGRVPQPLHEARGQIWRFQTRTSAYVELLTPTQPFEGFFGDPAPPVGTGAPVPAPGSSPDATSSWTFGDLTASTPTGVAPRDASASSTTTLSTTWPMSAGARVLFILCLLIGVYFQVQPSLLRWPSSYVIDRTMGPTLVTAVNNSVTSDLALYDPTGASCPIQSTTFCLNALTASSDVQSEYTILQKFQPFVVRGRNEYSAYLNQLGLIEITLDDLAAAPATTRPTALTQRYDAEESRLNTLYVALHRAI